MNRSISVVIPSYNYIGYLPQAVSSVVFQTVPDLELVLVDDASADGSADLVRETADALRAGGRRVKTIFHKTNLGAHAAINEGVAAASGELIAVLNADDLFEPNRFAAMTQKMGDARWAFSAVRCVGPDSRPLDTEQARAFEAVQRHIAGKRFMALAAVGENVAVSTGNLLFEKSLYEELGGFKPYKYVHDYDFFLRACLAAEPAYVPDTAYLYRLHGENSFTRLAKEGLVENRLVWLDAYAAVKAGRVQNPVILENPDYKEEFHAAVRAAGKKKETLWRLAGTPLARAGEAAVKKRYRL